MPKTFAIVATLAITATAIAACSSGGSGHSSIPDAAPDAEPTLPEASDENDQSPVFGCSEAQLAFGNGMPCAQCVVQNCNALLMACTNCVECQTQLSNCPACLAMCFTVPAGTAFDPKR